MVDCLLQQLLVGRWWAVGGGGWEWIRDGEAYDSERLRSW